MEHKVASKSIKSDVNQTAEQQLFMATLLTLSWQLLIVVVVPFIGGHYLDGKLKTTPLWTLVGLAVALALAILTTYNGYRTLTRKQTVIRGDTND